MKIYRPIKTNRLNQGFGADFCIHEHDKRMDGYPKVRGKCDPGYVLFYGSLGMKGHSGEDWGSWTGEPLYHSGEFDGWMKTEIDRFGGIGIDIVSNEPILNGNYVKLRYWHLKSVEGYDGKPVRMGQLIGYCDNTGLSLATHLHWSMKPCTKDGTPLDPGNGYMGAVDFRPYFENVFVLDVLGVKQEALSAIQKAKKLIELVKQFIKNAQTT